MIIRNELESKDILFDIHCNVCMLTCTMMSHSPVVKSKSLIPSSPGIPHLAPASLQANVRASCTVLPLESLWMIPALNVSPAANVSTSLGGG